MEAKMDQKILDALKTINEKLGGTNGPNEKWGTLLQEIAENIDSGGGGGGGNLSPMVLTRDPDDGALSETWRTITDAFCAGCRVVYVVHDELDDAAYHMTMTSYGDGQMIFKELFGSQIDFFTASSPDDYPVPMIE